MRLLILDSTPSAEQLMRSIRADGNDEVETSDLAPDLALIQCDADIALVAMSAFASPEELDRALEQRPAHAMSLVLIVDEISQLERLADNTLAAIDDFALRSATPEELRIRVEQVHRHRTVKLEAAGLRSDVKLKRAFASRVIGVQEAERHSLSKELHDGVGQMMLVHHMDAEWLAAMAENGPLRDAAKQMAASLAATLESVRNLAMDLRPLSIDDLGIGAALDSLVTTVCRRAGLLWQCDIDAKRFALPSDVSVAIYRIAQEALNNAARHSRCEKISVQLKQVGNDLHLRIQDDGIGFDPTLESGSVWLGLVGMRERADAIGARVVIDSIIDKGTSVTLVVPEILEAPRE